MAERFISDGAKVVITGRSEETLKKASEKLRCGYIVHDSRDTAVVDKVLESEVLIGGEGKNNIVSLQYRNISA